MTKRKSISKKRRFEIFKRDLFQCQYCGDTPPNTVLELDHIVPVSKGGKNGSNNLITSCFDCNRGKSDTLLENIPETLVNKTETLKEKRDQLRSYNRMVKSLEAEINKQIDLVDDAYSECNQGWVLNEKFRQGTVKKFIDQLGAYEVVGAMYQACNKVNDSQDCLSYFCGICWNKIRGTYE